MQDWVEIDGSRGEGGGQILRTALSLSILTQKPLRLKNIRARRTKPGLQRQHLTAVQASARISDAVLSGASLGSTAIEFAPQQLQPGQYHFNIGTAGSTSLVFQTVLFPLAMAEGPSTVTIKGGTHNSASPPFEFLAETYLPLLAKLGVNIEAKLGRVGYYPRGGGEVEFQIHGNSKLKKLDLMERGQLESIDAWATVADLPAKIGRRELDVISRAFSLDNTELIEQSRCGPGNVFAIRTKHHEITEIFMAFGQRKLRAEALARGLVDRVKLFLDSKGAVGPHLADQLLIPLALAGGGRFSSVSPSPHTQTNAAIISKFLKVDFKFVRQDTRWIMSI